MWYFPDTHEFLVLHEGEVSHGYVIKQQMTHPGMPVPVEKVVVCLFGRGKLVNCRIVLALVTYRCRWEGNMWENASTAAAAAAAAACRVFTTACSLVQAPTPPLSGLLCAPTTGDPQPQKNGWWNLIC
jgi:hypothetical protein